MGQDSKLAIEMSTLFDVKLAKFYKALEHENICSFMYAFGIKLRSRHLQYATGDSIIPYVQIFKPLWHLDIWIRATWGTDDVKSDEVYEKEADETHLAYYDYLISQAVKYNRPAWSIFGLIGMMQGSLNQNAFPIEKHEIFTKEDFLRCIKYLPADFLKKHKDTLEYLFSYFDERNYKLIIDLNEDYISIILDDFDKEKLKVKDRLLFSFFDGVNLYNNLKLYNNWLSSLDFLIWRNSYVVVEDRKLFIVKENSQELSTFNSFSKEELMRIIYQYNLEIKEENGIFYASTSEYNSNQLLISRNNYLTAIYSFEGGRSQERINIYGVFETFNHK
jgi:hypothetical protein